MNADTQGPAARGAALIQKRGERVQALSGIVGLDGFVDKIIRVVASRDDDEASYYEEISGLAERIARAAGKSTALELHVQVTKLGGNGPIMANALAAFGLPLSYIGAVGDVLGSGIHPVFKEMADRCTTYSVCPAASTDALEFNDGKLMLQQMACLDTLDFDAIERTIGRDAFHKLVDDADFMALNHWASLPHMSAIWRRLQEEVCPTLSAKPRQLFFDLADPEKRSHEDIVEALLLIGKFQKWYDVTLGLNEKESEHICEALDCEPIGMMNEKLMMGRAEAIRRKLGIGAVVVHPVQYAAAADANGSCVVKGAYTPKPLISTGAGDHFNSGFFLGRLLGGDLEQCLQLGVAVSGSYVRTARSPSLAELHAFLMTLVPPPAVV